VILSDDIQEKLARALRISDGSRLIRGWDNVLKNKNKNLLAKLSPNRKIDTPAVNPDVVPLSKAASTDSLAYDPEPSSDQDRDIHHLIFVVHGIGAKMQEKVVSMDLAEEVDILRTTLIKSAENFKTLVPDEEIEMPKGGGIQVLPIIWRTDMKVETQTDESKITLEDITLDGMFARFLLTIRCSHDQIYCQ
jgi:hypothetical protein